MPQQLPTAIVDAPKVPPQYRPASSVPLRIFAVCLTSVLVAVLLPLPLHSWPGPQ